MYDRLLTYLFLPGMEVPPTLFRNYPIGLIGTTSAAMLRLFSLFLSSVRLTDRKTI